MAAAKFPTISKMEAVRRALAALSNDAMPVKIQEYVEKTFGMPMSTAHVSNYKTAILRGKPKKTAGPKPSPKAAPVAVASASAPSKSHTGDKVSLEDVETVKNLVGRVGEKSLKNLIDLLG